MIDLVKYIYILYLTKISSEHKLYLKQYKNPALIKLYGTSYRTYKRGGGHFDLDLDLLRQIEIL